MHHDVPAIPRPAERPGAAEGVYRKGVDRSLAQVAPTHT